MTRQSKFDRRKRTGQSDENLLETIIEDILKAATMPTDDWWVLSQFPLTPLAIPISADREYRTTQVGVDAAHKLTRQLWQEREDYRQTIERGSFDRLSFRAIGQAIQAARTRLLEDPPDAERNGELDPVFYQELAADFRDILDRLAEEARTDVDQHIPCMLFHEDQMVPAISVGPVDFLPRADWIDRFVRDPETRNIVDRVEQRELTVDEVRRRALEPDSGRAIQVALTAITFLRGFSWVGTVRAAGHELKQSHRKMSTIVGLAIDAVGLRFHVDEARRFTKAGRTHLFGKRRLATAVDDGRFIYGSSADMPGLGAAPGALVTKMHAERKFLAAAGNILDVYLESRQTGDAPLLVEAWVNSLYWLGEARRDASDFMAVVKYGCALDGLSGAGGKSRDIAEFVESALKPVHADESPEGALTAAEAVELVYEKGRNKLTHGEIAGVLEDFSMPRRVGDALFASSFDAVTWALAEFVAEKDSHVLEFGKKSAYRALMARMRTRH